MELIAVKNYNILSKESLNKVKPDIHSISPSSTRKGTMLAGSRDSKLSNKDKSLNVAGKKTSKREKI